MAPPSLQQNLGQKGETSKRKKSNQRKETTVGSSKKERTDSQIPKKRKRKPAIESNDKVEEELRRTESGGSDSEATDDAEYEIEKIIAKRVDDSGCVYYTVRWKNYSPEDDSEEPESNVNAPKLIQEFEQEQRRLQKQSSERSTSFSQLPTTSRSDCPTSTLPNKIVNKNVAKTLPNELTSRTPVKELPSVHADESSNVSNVQSTSIVCQQPTAAPAKPLKEKRAPPTLPKKRAFINSLGSDHCAKILSIAKQKQQASTSIASCLDTLTISKGATSTTVASIPQDAEINSSVKVSLPKEKQRNDKNERGSTGEPSEPQDNRMSNGEASTAISTPLDQQANSSIIKTNRKNLKPGVTQPPQCAITTITNDVGNSQLSQEQTDIVKCEMDEESINQREEEHWRREKEQKRQESLARRMQGAEEKERLEAQRSAKVSKETEQIYDPRAASSSNNDDEIFDPRAVKNQKVTTNVRLPSNNQPSLPPCLLDRGIKIEKILKLFYADKELVGLVQYKNCLTLQIVTVEKIKESDPVALLKAYEEVFWGSPTSE